MGLSTTTKKYKDVNFLNILNKNDMRIKPAG